MSGQNACLTTTGWRVVDTLNTKMTISERRATTIFDRSNLTIMDVVDLSPPIPTNYTAEDFFFFYDIIFAANQNQENFSTTAQFLLMTTVATFINQTVTDTSFGFQATSSNLQQLLATPLLVYNYVVWGPPPTINMGNSMALAVPSYRVLPWF